MDIDQLSPELQKQVEQFYRSVFRDVEVELTDEFDRNFEREAFFNQKWARRKYHDDTSRGMLVSSGTLRRGLRSSRTEEKIIFTNDVPYASIHNTGGTIMVTRKMKGYFWHRYKEAMGKQTLRRDGALRQNKQNRSLSAAAQFYRAMALKPVGSKINIPKRQFIGMHPEVEKAIKSVIDDNYNKIFKR